MRRSDREVTDQAALCAVLADCRVMHLAMCDGGEPYVVPLNFGFEETEGQWRLYFHSAAAGKKLDCLRTDGRVCFAVDEETEPVTADTACRCGCLYRSVIGRGTAVELTDPTEKLHALDCLLRHQTGRVYAMQPRDAEAVAVFRIDVSQLTGKARTK